MIKLFYKIMEQGINTMFLGFKNVWHCNVRQQPTKMLKSEEDCNNIKDDWDNIGSDMWKAIDNVKK